MFLGVYLTEYTAFDNTKMIATDNYLRNAAQAQVDNGKLDYGFQVNEYKRQGMTNPVLYMTCVILIPGTWEGGGNLIILEKNEKE